MDCFKYKIQLSERITKSLFKNKFTTQFKNLGAQASEADYYIVYIYLTGGTRAAEPSVRERGHVRL